LKPPSIFLDASTDLHDRAATSSGDHLQSGGFMLPIQFRSLLVPLDGSRFAEQALPLATAIARQAGAILELALVHHPAPPLATALEVPEVGAQLDVEGRGREAEYLRIQAERIRGEAGLRVNAVLLDGGVAGALQRHVESSGADLVVLTTHGRGPVSRFWLGSVADQLMRRLHTPILFVRPGDAQRASAPISRIMVTLDGSTFAEEALGTAATLATIFDAGLHLVLVVEPPLPIADPSGMTVLPATVDAEQQLRTRAEQYLRSVVTRLAATGVERVSMAVEEAPSVAASLLAAVETHQIDLLVLASHGAGGIERMVIGSVADKVVRGSRIPVLVVRPLHGATVAA
jgi:nucleotide-binding universal stress UspA family protein